MAHLRNKVNVSIHQKLNGNTELWLETNSNVFPTSRGGLQFTSAG